jgi:hypothetical protein
MFTVIAIRKMDRFDSCPETLYLGVFSTREAARDRIDSHCKELRLLTCPFIYRIFTSEVDSPVVEYA